MRDGWSIGGMAKGAAMLAPGLATMLVVITTDAVVDPSALGDQLAAACSVSFDRIDSDGCMSTNDTVLLLSSGASGIDAGRRRVRRRAGRGLPRPRPAADGRRGGLGAHHRHRRCVSAAIARRRGRGRQDHRPEQPVQVRHLRPRPQLGKGAVGHRHHGGGLRAGPAGRRRSTASRSAAAGAHRRTARAGRPDRARGPVDVDLHAGSQATVWTNDLTYDYVRENAEYST